MRVGGSKATGDQNGIEEEGGGDSGKMGEGKYTQSWGRSRKVAPPRVVHAEVKKEAIGELCLRGLTERKAQKSKRHCSDKSVEGIMGTAQKSLMVRREYNLGKKRKNFRRKEKTTGGGKKVR